MGFLSQLLKHLLGKKTVSLAGQHKLKCMTVDQARKSITVYPRKRRFIFW